MKRISPELRQSLVLIAVAFALAWAPRLLWGFWTDEAGTYWMAAQGWYAAIGRCSQWAGQSILYGVLESFFVFPGRFQEIVLRIPSLVGAGLAAFFTYRIMERFVRPGSGPVAAVTLLCLPDVVLLGSSARPYGLVLAAACAAAYYLMSWRENGAWKPALAYALSAGLLVNLHYLAAFLFLPHAIYLAIGFRRAGKLPGWNLPVTAAGAVLVALIPLLAPLRTSVSQARTFAGGERPEWMQLLSFGAQPLVLLGVALGLVAAYALHSKVKLVTVTLPPDTAGLLLSWWILAPVVFFVEGRYGSHNLFTSRYMLMTLPAFAMLLSCAVSWARDLKVQRIITCGIFAATILHPAMLIQSFSPAPESWREPLAVVRSSANPGRTRVLVTSGLVESAHFDWKAEDPATSRFYAALTAYPLLANAEVRGLPFDLDDPATRNLEAQLSPARMEGSPLILICRDGSQAHEWFRKAAAARGLQLEEKPVNRLAVLRASAAEPPASQVSRASSQ